MGASEGLRTIVIEKEAASKAMMTAIIKKELLQLRRDPRLLALIVVMPLIYLILFGVALKLEPQNVCMAYYEGDPSFFTNLIKTGLWSDGYFDLYEVQSKEQIIEEIRSGRAKAGLFIDKDFSALLAVNVREGKGIAERFRQLQDDGIVVLMDMDGKVATSWGVNDYPTSFIVDAHGVIQRKVIGEMDWDNVEILTYIETLLSADTTE